jgi:hypothetical protein
MEEPRHDHDVTCVDEVVGLPAGLVPNLRALVEPRVKSSSPRTITGERPFELE